MAKKIFGIDFGTNVIKVYKKGEGIILLERTAVSTVGKGKAKRAIAIGEKSFEMFEKAPPSIDVCFPIHRGVVSHLDDMVQLWNYMGQKISGKKKISHCQFYLAVPADITEVEKQAYSKIVLKSESKPKKVFLIDKPIADAYGLGLDIEKSKGILIANLGADTCELSILSLGGLVSTKLIPFGGNDFDHTIQNYIRKKYNFVIGLKTAEQIKMKLIAAVPKEETITVMGRDLLKGLPREVTVRSTEIIPLVIDIFEKLANDIRSLLEHTPPEISYEILHNGIYLTGGTSQIEGMDRYLANQIKIRVNAAQNAQKTAAEGIGYLAEHPKLALKYAVPLDKKDNE